MIKNCTKHLENRGRKSVQNVRKNVHKINNSVRAFILFIVNSSDNEIT